MRLHSILTPRLLFVILVTVLVSINSVAGDDSTKGSPATRQGYVQCIAGKNPPPVLVYELPCSPKPIAELQCGDTVVVAGREGPWLRIRSTDGTDRFIGVLSVSLSKKKFQLIDLSPGPSPDMRACFVSLKLPDQPSPTHRPRVIHQVSAEFPEDGRRAGISGTVRLSLTVGIDGMAHNIEVKKSLGHGFDEQAVLSVQQWLFEPAAEDGKAIPAQIEVEVNFSTDK
jgi:TonB family protein